MPHKRQRGRYIWPQFKKSAKRPKVYSNKRVYSGGKVYSVDPPPVDHDATLKSPVAVHALRG